MIPDKRPLEQHKWKVYRRGKTFLQSVSSRRQRACECENIIYQACCGRNDWWHCIVAIACFIFSAMQQHLLPAVHPMDLWKISRSNYGSGWITLPPGKFFNNPLLIFCLAAAGFSVGMFFYLANRFPPPNSLILIRPWTKCSWRYISSTVLNRNTFKVFKCSCFCIIKWFFSLFVTWKHAGVLFFWYSSAVQVSRALKIGNFNLKLNISNGFEFNPYPAERLWKNEPAGCIGLLKKWLVFKLY